MLMTKPLFMTTDNNGAMARERGARADGARTADPTPGSLAAAKVLIIDDDRTNVEVLRRLLIRDGYRVVSASNGGLAVETAMQERPHVVLMDVNMPGMDGFEACRRLKQNPATRLLPVILISGLMAPSDRILGINAGADDFLSKPYALDELRARIRSLIKVKRHTDELESAESVILSLALILEARDPATKGHCDRLARYAVKLGEQLGLAEDQLKALHRGGYVHDIGKVGVADAILLKAGALNEAETLQMQQHTVLGEKLCGNLRSLGDVRGIVRHHHERPDGSGYPDGLRGHEIPLLALVIGVVDAYDAMTTARPYKRAFTREEACGELRNEAARGWKRMDIVEAFVDLLLSGRLDEIERE
jgi:putative two-component system response regulator